MRLPSFDLHRPDSIEEALKLRRALGEDAAFYAGGTELILAMKLGLLRYRHLIDVKQLPGSDQVSTSDGTIRVGAAVTHRMLERHPAVMEQLPTLAGLERNVANVRVRAQGTLAGNLAFAEPRADPPALLVALGARVVLGREDGIRRLSIPEFLLGAYQTALRPDEMIIAIEVPVPSAGVRAAYVKFQVLERPSIGVATVAAVQDGCFLGTPTIVVGAADETPRFVPSGMLTNARFDDASALEEIAAAARDTVEPVGDLSGSADYKRHLAGVFTRRALASLMAGT